jgi:hypothetical protein
MSQTRHIDRCGIAFRVAVCLAMFAFVVSPAAGTDDAAPASTRPAQAASPAQTRLDGLLSKITRIEWELQSSSNSTKAVGKTSVAAELTHLKSLRKALLETNGSGWESVMAAADRATLALLDGGRVMVVIAEPASADGPAGLASLKAELLRDTKSFTPGVFELIGTVNERQQRAVGPSEFLFVLGGDVPVRSTDKGTYHASLQKLIDGAGRGVCYIAPASGVKRRQLPRGEMFVDSILDGTNDAELALLQIIKAQVMHDVAQQRQMQK